jgi:hypothetical protein
MTTSRIVRATQGRTPRVPPPAGIRLAIGAAAVAVAAFAASAIPGSDGPQRTLLVAAAVGAFAAWSDDWMTALLVAALGFLVVDGFLVDSLGQLSWHGGADVLRLSALVGAAVIGTTLAPRGAR